jgi:hypothetical protein
MMKFNQPVTTYDVAQLLKGEHGTFLVQRAGQTAIVVAAEGHSIKSWTPVGSIEPINLSAGNNPPYTCTRIDLTGDQNDDLNPSRNR